MAGSVLFIYRSPGHDFKGHHGMPRGNHLVEELPEAELVAGKGIVGDRYFGFKEDFKGQITFFPVELAEEMQSHFALPELSPQVLRRNVVTRDVPLLALVGRRFRLQGVLFEGAEECSPCYWMDQAVAPGAEEFLRGRGGLRARILESGLLRVGAAELELL